jgi:CRISPR/Cas system-associated exonuclease Cas4 (RecB family)
MANYKYERTLPYQPGQKTPFKVSRSKIEDYVRCPRCFWLDKRLKISKPSMPAFLINSAIDELLKKEFDIYRAKDEQHPWQIEFKVDAKPYAHKDLEKWRHTFTGIQYLHEPTNFLVFGGVDDVWVTPEGQLIIVDYKATAKTKEITDLDPSKWHDSYRRQMEVYQWLFKNNGFDVSTTGYFVYANGMASNPGFYNKVEFRTNVFPYIGDDSWVEPTLLKMKECLDAENMPPNAVDCEHCDYAKSRTMLTLDALKKKSK